jgi:hypothetical protein
MNKKARFKAALKRYINIYSFYSLYEFLIFTNGSRSLERLSCLYVAYFIYCNTRIDLAEHFHAMYKYFILGKIFIILWIVSVFLRPIPHPTVILDTFWVNENYINVLVCMKPPKLGPMVFRQGHRTPRGQVKLEYGATVGSGQRQPL